jgi:hypothetical protein
MLLSRHRSAHLPPWILWALLVLVLLATVALDLTSWFGP